MKLYHTNLRIYLRDCRYRYTDYAFHSSLHSLHELPQIVVSYDITCQWSLNFWNRAHTILQHLQLDKDSVDITFLVPKFYLPPHVSQCQSKFSFNHVLHIGQTDGKAPECMWHYLDSVANMLREMGPSTRLDFLNNFMADWNWKKAVALG